MPTYNAANKNFGKINFGQMLGRPEYTGPLRPKSQMAPQQPTSNFLPPSPQQPPPPSPDGLSQDARDTMAIQNNMMMPSRGFKRAGGDKPSFMGQGMNDFYTKNPQIARGPERANQIAAERQGQLNRGVEAGRAAVKEKLAEQQMQAQAIRDNAGKNRSINRGYGVGSVEFLPAGQKARGTMTDPLTGKQVYMDEYLPQQSIVQDTKYGAMPGQEGGGALARLKAQQLATPKPSGASQNFLPQISPSGGGTPSLVGAGGSQGAPGGDFNTQMNDFYKTQYSNPFEGQPIPMTPNSGPPDLRVQGPPDLRVQGPPDLRVQGPPDLRVQGPPSPFLPQSGNLMGPNRPNEFGPALPDYTPEQLQAMKTLAYPTYGSQLSGVPVSNFSTSMVDQFPGNDYDFIKNLFPGQGTSWETINKLKDMATRKPVRQRMR
jgi:hypothetical protein